MVAIIFSPHKFHLNLLKLSPHQGNFFLVKAFIFNTDIGSWRSHPTCIGLDTFKIAMTYFWTNNFAVNSMTCRQISQCRSRDKIWEMSKMCILNVSLPLTTFLFAMLLYRCWEAMPGALLFLVRNFNGTQSSLLSFCNCILLPKANAFVRSTNLTCLVMFYRRVDFVFCF